MILILLKVTIIYEYYSFISQVVVIETMISSGIPWTIVCFRRSNDGSYDLCVNSSVITNVSRVIILESR